MAKDWDSMYTYWEMSSLMGFFAGFQPVVASFIADIWSDADPMTRMKMNRGIMKPIIGSVAIGTTIASAIAADNLFLPLWIGGALELVGAALVIFLVPNIEKAPVDD